MSRIVICLIVLTSTSGCLFFGSDTNNQNPPQKDASIDLNGPDLSGPDAGCPEGEIVNAGGRCQSPLTCNNKKLESTEDCDPSVPGAAVVLSCDDFGYHPEGEVRCVDCFFDDSECGFCGDGVLNGDEECDGPVGVLGSCDDSSPTTPYGEPSCSADCKVDKSTCRGGFIKVSVGQRHICAVTRGKKVVCWGGATSAEGPNLENENFEDVEVAGPNTCGLKSDASVVCWDTTGEEVGDRITDVVEMSAGSKHHCFRFTNNKVHCIGLPGLTGVGPQEYLPLQGSSQISSGSNFVCGLISGNIECSGMGVELPNGVGANGGYDSIYAGSDYVCGQKGTDVHCPTDTYNNIGPVDVGSQGVCWIDSTNGSTLCVGVMGNVPTEELSSLSVGNGYACGIVSDSDPAVGEIRCWGNGITNGTPLDLINKL